MHMGRHRIRATLLPILALGLLPGCEGGKVSLENDELRQRVLVLERENEQLRSREQEMQIELEQESRRVESLPSEVRESVPHVTELSIGRLSHARDLDDDGRPDEIVIYLTTTDGYGRFVQAVGRVSVHAVMFPPGENALTVGLLVLDPPALRQAYRSGVSGTHYTIELPIELDEDPPAPSVVVNVQYEDGRTGAIRSDEREISLRR